MSSPLSKSDVLFVQRLLSSAGLYKGPLQGKGPLDGKFNQALSGGSAATIPTDNQLDRLMEQAKGARKAERGSALVTSWWPRSCY
jgi:hypothetical protein